MFCPISLSTTAWNTLVESVSLERQQVVIYSIPVEIQPCGLDNFLVFEVISLPCDITSPLRDNLRLPLAFCSSQHLPDLVAGDLMHVPRAKTSP